MYDGMINAFNKVIEMYRQKVRGEEDEEEG